MATTKRKPATRGRKSSPAAKGPPRSRRRPAVAADLPLQQGLVEMATVGAHSFVWLTSVVLFLAALAAAAVGIWSLRPLPAYSSDRVTAGSAFQATFRVQNVSAWFPLSHLKIHCALTSYETPDMVAADQSWIPDRLDPGQSATFTCAFPAADLDVALRSEIYFRSEYDAPVLSSFRIANNGGPFVLDTRLLPPRWTAKPGRD
ncbi:MAG TPA: hypothetical protein VKY24_02825 [Reyranella sp.]|nr:hypothetical protein [Reyranella sp.]